MNLQSMSIHLIQYIQLSIHLHHHNFHHHKDLQIFFHLHIFKYRNEFLILQIFLFEIYNHQHKMYIFTDFHIHYKNQYIFHIDFNENKILDYKDLLCKIHFLNYRRYQYNLNIHELQLQSMNHKCHGIFHSYLDLQNNHDCIHNENHYSLNLDGKFYIFPKP